jgi:hypothetical protein
LAACQALQHGGEKTILASYLFREYALQRIDSPPSFQAYLSVPLGNST